MDRRIIARYAIRELLGLVFMGAALFWSAGQLDWWPAWASMGIMLGWIISTAIVIVRRDPSLLAERLGPRKGAKRWDTAILSLLGISQLARYVVAGLDHRNGWSGSVALGPQLAALIVCALAYALVVWATASNAFFSQIVRIQTERGHTVAASGPYHYVRHPAYLGSILYELAVPVLFSSSWSMIPSALNALLLTVRTTLEDRTLRAELTGYADYAQQVRSRLIPGIW